jgi:hypothetical protein
MHRRCLSLVVEGCRDDGAGVRAMDDHAGDVQFRLMISGLVPGDG